MRVRGVESLGALLGLALAASPGLAGAAPVANENGIKVGEGRLHPFFDLELRYDSAAGMIGAGRSLAPELVAHFRPGLRLEIPSPTFALNFNGSVDYVFYTGALTSGSMTYSHFETDLGLEAAVNRSGQIEFDFGDHFMVTDRTTNVAAPVGVLSTYNNLHASVPIKPGGGALEVTPHGAWSLEQLSPNPPGVDTFGVSAMSYMDFQGGLDARWKFLPKTAVVFESAFDSRGYQSAAGSTMLLKIQAGLAGLVSPKIATLAMVGWTHGFAATDGKTVTGHLEISYLASETANFKVGYLRSIELVPLYGTYGRDGIYVGSRFMFGGKLAAHVNGGFDFLTFYGSTAHADQIIWADLGPEYQFTPWLIASLNYNMSLRLSPVQPLNRHEVIARVEFTY